MVLLAGAIRVRVCDATSMTKCTTDTVQVQHGAPKSKQSVKAVWKSIGSDQFFFPFGRRFYFFDSLNRSHKC